MSLSSNGMDTLSVYCRHTEGGFTTRCLCHFNIYFVVRDVKADTLWLKCRVPNDGYDDFEGEVRLNADSSVVIWPQKHLFGEWYLEGYGSVSDFRLVEQDEESPDYFITLTADSTMQGRSLCNTIYGKFECDGQSFRFTSFGGTKVGCQSEIENPESSFFNTLPKVSRYSIGKDSRLRLYYADDRFCQFRWTGR